MTLIPPFSGRCLCGAVTFRCTQAPIWQGHGHSESSRRATAAPFTSFFGVRNGTWARTGATPTTYPSSPGTWRDFCPTCGTQMAYRSTRWSDEKHLYAATLDDPTIFQPARHDHASERLPWVYLADDLPQQ